jgi:hypothetical protein
MPYKTAAQKRAGAKRRREKDGARVREQERAAYARWITKHPEALEARKKRLRRAQLKCAYALSEADYQALLILQNSVCAICHCPETRTHSAKTDPLVVDHDHTTGKVRGLLCHRCNTALGLMKDDVARLLSAVAYLKRTCEGAKADK